MNEWMSKYRNEWICGHANWDIVNVFSDMLWPQYDYTYISIKELELVLTAHGGTSNIQFEILYNISDKDAECSHFLDVTILYSIVYR